MTPLPYGVPGYYVGTGVPAAHMTIQPAPLEGELCHTVVQFTCIIEDLPALRWFINDNSIATYGHTNGDTFPITLSSPLPGIEISITSAAPDSVDPLFLDQL